MAVDPRNVNERFIAAVFNWLCKFPSQPVDRSFSLAEIVQPRIINRILTSILDASIPDLSPSFASGNGQSGKEESRAKYLERLISIAGYNYVKHNTHIIKDNPYTSYAANAQDFGAALKGAGSKTTKLTMSKSFEENTLNYYLGFLSVEKLSKLPDKRLDDALYEDYVQIQALFSAFVEIGWHCKQSPLCITLFSFLERRDRKEFEWFLKGGGFFERSSSGLLSSDFLSSGLSSCGSPLSQEGSAAASWSSDGSFESGEFVEQMLPLENADHKSVLESLKRAQELCSVYRDQYQDAKDQLEEREENVVHSGSIKSVRYAGGGAGPSALYRQSSFVEHEYQSEIQALTSEVEQLRAENLVLAENQGIITDLSIRAKRLPISRANSQGCNSEGRESRGHDTQERGSISDQEYIKALEWDLDIMERFYFEHQYESLTAAEERLDSAASTKLLMVKKYGREVFNMLRQ